MHSLDLGNYSFINPIIDWLNQVLPKIPGAVIGLLVGILAVRLLVRLSYWVLKQTGVPKGLRQLVASVLETGLWLWLFVFFRRAAGFGAFLLFFSSSALARGILLAAGGSPLLSDVLAGVFLVRAPDFNVGDEVQLGASQVQGVVETMDSRRV